MVSPEAPDRHQTPIDPPSSPRISFSTDFLDDTDFISISPNPSLDTEISSNQNLKSPDFEFLSNKGAMLTADELFFEGKFLPFRQTPAKIALKSSNSLTDEDKISTAVKAPLLAPEPRIWFIDDDPSPRPPKCTVLWKELLRLRKQKVASAASSLSPSSSTSSSSSSSSSSLGDHVAAMEEAKGPATALSTREKHMRRIKKGLERTKSAANIRIRPMVNVPVCTPNVNKNSSSLPPLFPIKKGKGRSLER